MRILVVGAGALGGFIGSRLTTAGHTVTFLEKNVARARLLSESGLIIAGADGGETTVPMHCVSSVEGLAPVDLLFLAVKSYQTEDAVREALPAIGGGTWVLSTQNGVGNVETIARLLGPERVLSGITFHSIQHTGPNRIRYRGGIKPIQMSPMGGVVTPEVTAIGESFNAAGLTTEVVADVGTAVWQKLLHNAVVNPVSALTGKTCSEMLEDEELQALMRRICEEIVAVMRARGVPIQDEEDPYRPVVGSQKALAKNRPSMWQDLMRGFRTEIDAINGGVVDEAARLGLSAPVNWAIVRLIHSREREQQRRKERSARLLADVRTAQEARGPLRPTVPRRLSGMPAGRVPLECAPRLKEIVRDYYRDLDRAGSDPNRHLAWVSALGPVEVVRAMGYTPYFPENHAALIGASRLADHYISLALADGFSPFVSTEMTSEIGATLAGESPLVTLHQIRGIPKPEFLVYSTNCGQYMGRWFEYYGHRLGVPVYGLHPPAGLDEVESIDIDAGMQQLHRLIRRIGARRGTMVSGDALGETVARSARAAGLWRRILELGRIVPSPLTYFDTLIHMAPMLLLRGTEDAVTYYEVLLAELEHRVADGVAAVPGERHRFYWDGPPIWCALKPLASLFLDHGIAIVGSTYARLFALDGLHGENAIESMARVYTSIFTNRSREYKARALTAEFRDLGVDAAVFHDARTAPDFSSVRYGLHNRLKRETGVRPLVIEADSHDLRLVSIDQIRRQLLELLEVTAAGEGRGEAAS